MNEEHLAGNAIRIDETGPPEVMRFARRSDAVPGPGEIAVDVAAAGVNFIDVYHRSGLYPMALPAVLGQEGAGTVTEAGEGVAWPPVGERVAWANALGSYARRNVIPAAAAVAVPDGIDLQTAAAVPLQGMTAHYLATDCPRLKPGDLCLVHAGAGGAGRLLVQMAKLRGARVVATVGSDAKVELARSAGADYVVNYTTSDLVAGVEAAVGAEALDVVYDGVGASVYDDSLRLLRPRGMMVSFGNASGAVEPKSPLHLAVKSLWLCRPTLAHFVVGRAELEARAAEVFGWVESGQLDIRIAAVMPLPDAADAHRLITSRKAAGKILLIP